MPFSATALRYWRGTCLLLALLLPGVRPAHGQAAVKSPADPIKYGQIDVRDLTTAPFAADSGAAAVVLCDYGRSRLKGQGAGFQVVFERVTRIKILSKAGYDQATVEIPLYHRDNDQEKVTNLRGCTYNLVNGVVEKNRLEPTGAFLEKRTPTESVQRFTMPNVREGSVIEFAYTLTSDFLFNFQDWTFQRDIPVRWSEYRVSIPSFYRYKIICQGGRPFDVNEARTGSTNLVVDDKVASGGGIAAGQVTGSLTVSALTEEHRWVLKNLPALVPEPYMTTPRDYLARLDFELAGEQWPDQPYRDLTGDWEKINRTLLAEEDFGRRIDHAGFLQAPARALAVQYPIERDRAAAVRELVMAAVRYNGTDQLYTEAPLRKAYDAHLGTSAEVNLLLLAALRDAGLMAYPVLLSTRSHGAINRDFPLLDRFNYVAAVVKLAVGTDLLLDATAPLLPAGALPTRCLSYWGRVVGPTPATSRWLDLTPTLRHVHYQQVSLALDAQGNLSGTVHEEYGGYAAAEERASLASLGEKKYLAQVAQRHEAWTLSAPALVPAGPPDQPLTLNYGLRQPAEHSGGDQYYLRPLHDFGPGQNPFRSQSRAFDVDFGMAHEEILAVTLTLPPGYELAEPPKNAVISLPDGTARFVYNATSTGATVQLLSRLTLRSPVYAAAQYADLRELYRLMLAKQAERLVVQKKAGG
ncbi:MAG: DUF3857 domain-containing protein [Bacteroidota bacterium]|nr:DUF3857 domain-containing protein [Bacteroidota bacterium]